MNKVWFETVAEAQRRAKKRLPKPVYSALVAGSEQGITLEDNVAAFAELGVAPHTAGLPAKRDLTTTVMGQSISMPVIISPTGVQAVHPDGEVAVARAAAARGIAMGLSSFAGKPIEEVAVANSQTFFQMYWVGTRDEMAARVERARQAGAVGVIATLDWSFSHGRDWSSPRIPERVTFADAMRFAPETLRHPKWLSAFIKSGQLPNLRVPTWHGPEPRHPRFPVRTGNGCTRHSRAGTMLRGSASSLTAPSCRRACAASMTPSGQPTRVSRPSRSPITGNNLDGTPATIRVLPGIADIVGGQIEVVLDGGVRRGSDVIKALALGARAVMTGRACLWGLAANGQAGVENMLDILRGGIDSGLLGLARTSVTDLKPEDLVIPPGFMRRLGEVTPS